MVSSIRSTHPKDASSTRMNPFQIKEDIRFSTNASTSFGSWGTETPNSERCNRRDCLHFSLPLVSLFSPFPFPYLLQRNIQCCNCLNNITWLKGRICSQVPGSSLYSFFFFLPFLTLTCGWNLKSN